MFTMAPRLRARRTGSTARVTFIAPKKFVGAPLSVQPISVLERSLSAATR